MEGIAKRVGQLKNLKTAKTHWEKFPVHKPNSHRLQLGAGSAPILVINF